MGLELNKKEWAATALTAGLFALGKWLWKKHVAKKVAKKVPRAVLDVLGVVAANAPGAIPPQAMEAIDDLITARTEADLQAKVDKAMAQIAGVATRLETKLAKAPPPLVVEMAKKRADAIAKGKAKIPPRGRK